ncbi:MAG: hypothetical protein QNK51_05730 [Chitinophagales bacterium]
MKKHYLQVQRTARYFLSGQINDKIKQVLVVLHGYAQNADDFLEAFASLQDEHTLVVAPEGLSKFYWKDFSSNPSSSWMTSLERENEILDTMHYLERVVQEVQSQLPMKGITYTCLGFSQGAATASRLCCNRWITFSKLFLYGGAPAHDLNWNALPKDLSFHLIYGDKDVFVSKSQVEKVQTMIKSKHFFVKAYSYQGKHKIENKGLELIKSILY